MATASDFLSFPCKRTDRLDIKTPISKYVLRAYGKERAEDILQDMEEVSRRRTEVVAVSGGGPSEGAKEICASYFRALSVMETRFPISRDSSHAQVPFYWMNAMNPRKKCKQMNIHFEKAAVLFNIAAHLSQSAAQQNRESQVGYKEAIQQFQDAATVLAQVRDVALKVENPKPVDLTADFLMMAEKLMLAQGQECVFWKASKDQKSPLLLARLAKQTSILYAEALAYLANPITREDLDRSWQDLVQSKSWLFESLCQHHASEDAGAKEDISTEISRLNQCAMLLERLQKGGKFATPVLPTLVYELVSTTTSRLQKAERDNASVYLKRVLPFNELPLISGAQLVKLGECPYLDASNEHIFSELIPEPITKALSRYSEMVDDLIRKQVNKLNGATDDARLRLKQYELPELLDSVTSSSAAMLSEALKKDLEDIEQCGGLSYLEDMLAQLNGLKSSAMTDLEKTMQTLDEEAAQDSASREQYGEQWTARPSAGQTAGFRKLITSYQENITNADNSDRVIQEKLKESSGRFAFLAVAACVERLPKLEAGMVSTSDLEPQTLVANLRSPCSLPARDLTISVLDCLDQLSAMSDERAGLEESLKEMKNKDNLLPKLVSTGVGSHEELFKMEIRKYDQLTKDVDENLKKQSDLLDYVRQALSSFQQTFDIPAWKQKIDQYCKDVKTDITGFYDVRTNLGEGMRFYMNLKTHIDTVKQHTADFVLSRKLDRDDRLELLKAREKPAGMAAAQGPPPLPAEPPQHTAPPSVPSDPTVYASAPPPPAPEQHQTVYASAPPPPAPEHPAYSSAPPQQPVQATAQSYYAQSYAAPPSERRQDSDSGQATAPPAPYPPANAYTPQGTSSVYSGHSDAMVDSPNPYHPPPAQQQQQQQPTYYHSYQHQGQYPHPQYQPGAPPTGPPQNYYQGAPVHQPLQYTHPGSGHPPPQYQQGGYYQQQGQPPQHPYQPGQPPQFPYQQQGQPPQQPYSPPGQQPPSQGHPNYPGSSYPYYQQQ